MDFDLQLAVNCTESFALASGLGCALSNAKGKVLHSCGLNHSCCGVCAAAGKKPELCFEAHRYGTQEAERFGGKYIYFCSMGLAFFTSPILNEQGIAARITAGPFLMVDEQDYIAYDLNEMALLRPEQIPAVMEKVRGLPYVEARRVTALSELLFMSVAFLNNVSEANRMMENGLSVQMQGEISEYLFRMKKNSPQPYPFREEKRFLQALSRGDQAQAQELLNVLLGHIMFESGSEMARIRERIYELLIMISRTAIDAGGDQAMLESYIKQFRTAQADMNTVEELCLWLSRVVRSLIDNLFSNRVAKHSDLIYRTIQYMQLHYARKLTLDEISHNAHISPAYLSRIFKKETGCSIVDFLNQVRIEKSKELLADEKIRLIEVALQCGFESQSYFNRMFKQVCGITPQKYRKLMTEA